MHLLHMFSVFGALSTTVAILTAWTALDLLHQVRERHGRARLPWLLAAAVAMGGGIWSMHFIAMLGFNPGTLIGYDMGITALSLALAIVGTTLAFFIALSQKGETRILVSGVLMGLSISGMHYLGMAAIRTTAQFSYDPILVSLSILIALSVSTAALVAAEYEGSTLWKVMAALGLGLAVVGMHYTGMAALSIDEGAPLRHVHEGAPPLIMALGVAGVTLVILILALVASMLNQRDKLIAIMDAGGIGYWELPMSSRTPWISPRARTFLNLPQGAQFLAKDLEDHLSNIDPDTRLKAFERTLHGDGEYDIEYFLPSAQRWLHFRGRMIRSRTGKPVKLAGVVIDVTDRHNAFSALETSEHRQRLLLNELNHRVKNTLATIQSIAALTARRTHSTEEFMALFESRLTALSDTHNLLTANGWERARLRDLIHQEFRPFADDQLKIEGPDITLGAEQALAMGLVLHEMATNAAKYGALSSHETKGRVILSWTKPDPTGLVHLSWHEEGGPAVDQPTRKGFGSRLIETSIRGVLRGSVSIDFDARGVRCEMSFHPISLPKAEPGSPGPISTQAVLENHPAGHSDHQDRSAPSPAVQSDERANEDNAAK